MTYADIKNQYKTVEEIENRINAINDIFDERDNAREEQVEKELETLNEIVKPILPEDWAITSYSPFSNVQISRKDDSWHSIYIYAKYDLDMSSKDPKDYKEVWKFTMNPSSCGEFEVFGESDAKKYFKVVASLMTNEDVMHQLEDALKKYADNYEEIKKKMRGLRSEQKQLEILKKNIEESKAQSDILDEVKSIEDKTSIVIIDKNADPEKAVGTHRGTPVTIHSLPVPNDKYEEELKKCKEMQKMNKAARYIPTQVRFIKLY